MALSLLAGAVVSPAAAQMSAQEIIQRSAEANEVDWKAAPSYDHFERDLQSDGSTKTYHVLMILGSPYQQLVEVDGKPLPPEQRAAEQTKLEQEIARRKSETPQQREARIAGYKRDRTRDHVMIDQLTQAFDFTLVGGSGSGPKDTYVLDAKPRRGYRPPNTDAAVLTGMEGRLWIDKNTFEWVKVEAHVVHPVSVEGFLAKVEPGTRFELEKMPVAEGVWLPKHFAMRARAKVFFVFNHNSEEDETFYGYTKAGPLAEEGTR